MNETQAKTINRIKNDLYLAEMSLLSASLDNSDPNQGKIYEIFNELQLLRLKLGNLA